MAGARDALIIATGNYEDPELRRLRAPAQDADALARILGDPAVGEFNVQTLVDQPERMISRAAQQFFAGRGLDDLLLLHLSCHGVKDDEGRLYFAAADSEKEYLASTAVSSGFLNDLIEGCRARSIVLLLDCCYSGAFLPGAKGDEGVHLKERFEGEGRAILTASNAIEYSWEGDDLSGEGAPSVFTAAIVEGLETGEADRDHDGRVSIDDLYKHVYERVRNAKRGQTPQKWARIEHDLYIARNPRPVKSEPVALPDELQAALESPFTGVRHGAVEDLSRLLGSRTPGLVLAAKQALEHLLEDDSRKVSAAAEAAIASHGVVKQRSPEPHPAQGQLPEPPTDREPRQRDTVVAARPVEPRSQQAATATQWMDLYDVIVTVVGPKPDRVAKILAESSEEDYRTFQNLLGRAPVTVLSQVSYATAEGVRRALIRQGADAEIKLIR